MRMQCEIVNGILTIQKQISIDGRPCSTCNIFKSWNNFTKSKYGVGGYLSSCKDCRSISDSLSARKHNLKRKYDGFTPEQYNEMLAAQNGVCYICKKPPKNRHLAIDHNHQTGQIRKLLCTSCNYNVGVFESKCLQIQTYLKEHLN